MSRLCIVSLLCVLSAIGCSRQTPEEAEAAKATVEAAKVMSDLSEAGDKLKEQEERLLQRLQTDKQPIVDLAVKKFRKSIEENFGTDEAARAKITADKSGIKEFGGKKWKVKGQYIGPDENGKEFSAEWEATIEVMFSSLSCSNVKLGERKY